MKGSIKKIKDIDGNALYPLTVSEAVYTDIRTTLKSSLADIESRLGVPHSYVVELGKWNIRNDGTDAEVTTKGINDAIVWAKSKGYNQVILPNGLYSVKLDTNGTAVYMYSGLHLCLEEDCHIQLEGNSSPNYNIIQMKQIRNAKVSGGKITGDKKDHQYEIYVSFERGGVNEDGSLNNDSNFIRSRVIDRYEHPGLLAQFRLWAINGVNAPGYSFYQYNGTVSKDTLVGFRSNGGFAPDHPEGRGWLAPIASCNKMIFVIDISASPLTDAQIAAISAKVDNVYYTHEGGLGIGIESSNDIEIEGVEVSDCTGDGILTGIGVHYSDPSQYTQEEMGQHIYIHRCDIHHCRRQGITLGGSNDTYLYQNRIHHIGYADDNSTSDFRNGTPPMFGIDVESLVAQNNFPYKSIYLNQDGLETNYRIYISDNYIHNNAKGHFVNTDGTDISIIGNTFEGYNIGGISSYPHQWYVKYLDNTFVGCELTVEGNNFVNGGIFDGGNLKLLNVMGAVVQNCQIHNGLFYGSSIYGYLGMPANVDIPNGIFTYENPHGMGNGSMICFEQWYGKLPGGISVDTLYYAVNVTSIGFQVSETRDGAPISITDAGQSGFNISRYDYGRCRISDIWVEKDWKDGNQFDGSTGFSILAAGAVVENITTKNCTVSINPPESYVGRPNFINNLHIIEGTASFQGCQGSNIKIIRAKTGMQGGDVNLGADTIYSRVNLDNCFFQGVQVNFGSSLLQDSIFINASVYKPDTPTVSFLLKNYMENVKINLHWLTHNNSMTIARCVFNQVEIDANPSTRQMENLDISGG